MFSIGLGDLERDLGSSQAATASRASFSSIFSFGELGRVEVAK